MFRAGCRLTRISPVAHAPVRHHGPRLTLPRLLAFSTFNDRKMRYVPHWNSQLKDTSLNGRASISCRQISSPARPNRNDMPVPRWSPDFVTPMGSPLGSMSRQGVAGVAVAAVSRSPTKAVESHVGKPASEAPLSVQAAQAPKEALKGADGEFLSHLRKTNDVRASGCAAQGRATQLCD